MQTMNFGHDPGLVAASFLIALAAGFTGLSLTKDLSKRPLHQRKVAIALASVALGGGIWSMHFVAMLGLQLPILFYYDSAVTLASALIAILIVSVALSLLHFSARSAWTLTGAGAIIAIGILAMHYIGMAGLELCRAIYTPAGIFLAALSALALCIAAIWCAYGRRTNRNILLGALCFGTAVFAVHFAAVSGTRFVEVPGFNEVGPIMSNEVLALGVILSSFAILGAFLWMGVTFLMPDASRAPDEPGGISGTGEDAPQAATPSSLRIPCEKDGATVFVDSAQVAFVRADGRYTNVYSQGGRHFCTWPIAKAADRLGPCGFVKTHRSFLINPDHVTVLERHKDNGQCRFVDSDLPPVPVSRSKMALVRDAMGM